MDLRKIGILLIFIGIVLSVTFIDGEYLVPCLTVTMLGFFITIVGYIEEVKKTKEINDRLDKDIESVLQPLITKYSNLNQNYLKRSDSLDEYIIKRKELNKNLEKEINEKLPYFDSRQVKKIIIEFNKEQDKLLNQKK